MQPSEREGAAGVRARRPARARGGRGLTWAATALGVVAGCALPSAVTPEDPPLVDAGNPAHPAGAFSDEQHRQLRAGERVEELVELERPGRRYVGGVSYALVPADPRQIFDVLNHLDTLSEVLPHTRSARLIDRAGNRVRVEIEQGNSVVSTRFTVFFERHPASGKHDAHLVRFWLDPSQPHGIDDVWGFFRATRYDDQRSLVSVGVLVDLGPGLIRLLFEQRIQRAILRMPSRIRDVVERASRDVGPSASAARRER